MYTTTIYIYYYYVYYYVYYLYVYYYYVYCIVIYIYTTISNYVIFTVTNKDQPSLPNQHARYCAYCHFPALLTPLWLIGHWQAICRTTCYPSNVVRATSGVERFACHVVLMDEPAHSL